MMTFKYSYHNASANILFLMSHENVEKLIYDNYGLNYRHFLVF